MATNKFLVIRFSSFGDVLQALSIPSAIRRTFPDAEVHLATRADYAELAYGHPHIARVWGLDRRAGFKGLLHLTRELKKQKFTHIYDAHNNLRSHLVCWGLNGPLGLDLLLGKHRFLRRSKYLLRRWLLFDFHVNLYPQPFVGQWALLEPLQAWKVSLDLPLPPQLFLPVAVCEKASVLLAHLGKTRIALAPSASYEIKRWPENHWRELIRRCPEWQFVLLGGPVDAFIEEIAAVAPERCLNLAGRLSFQESAAVVAACDVLVANDTGLMHVAEQRGLPCVALMGPAPFGYPGRPTTVIKELDLSCRPCSKHGQGPCVNSEFKKCLADITPEEVAKDVANLLRMSRS